MSQQIFGLVAQQKGGTGKSTYTDFLSAASLAAGKETLVVDVDDGNSGFIRRCGKGSAVSLPWDMASDSASEWIGRHLDGKEMVLFDLGANLFTSGAPVTEFLADAVTQAQSSGARIVFFAVASTNSPGCGRLVTAMRDDFGSLGEVRIVECNVDGSGAFEKSITTLGLRRIRVEYIDPGIQAVRLLRPEPLLNVLRQPTPGYELATARYAQMLLDFARQDNVLDLVGSRALEVLGPLTERDLVQLYFVVRNLAQAGNETIQANYAYGRAHRALREANELDAKEVYEKAREFIAAARAYPC